jgi:hypothetical protein
MRILGIVITIGLALGAAAPRAEPGLDNCVDQFPGGAIEQAPTRAGFAPADPATGNVHICERSGETSFLALEYDPERLAPIRSRAGSRTASAPIDAGACPRDHMRCHFGRDHTTACLVADSKPGHPFHIEAVLVELVLPHLRTEAFSGTQHDRGHMAPNNAFSWHLCWAYKTFTMANISRTSRSARATVLASCARRASSRSSTGRPTKMMTSRRRPSWCRTPTSRA